MRNKLFSKEDNSKLDSFENDIFQKNKAIDALNRKNAAINYSYQELEKYLKEKHDKLYEKSMLLQEYQVNMQKEELDVKKSCDKIKKNLELKKKKESELKKLERSLSLLNTKLKKRESELGKKENDLKFLKENLDDKKKEFNDEIKFLEKEKVRYDSQITSKQNEILDLETSIKDLDKHNRKLIKQSQASELLINKIQNDQEKVQILVDEKRRELEDLSLKFKTVQSDFLRYQGDYEKIVHKINPAKEELRELRGLIKAKHQELYDKQKLLDHEEREHKDKFDKMLKNIRLTQDDVVRKQREVDSELGKIRERKIKLNNLEIDVSKDDKNLRVRFNDFNKLNSELHAKELALEKHEAELRARDTNFLEREDNLEAQFDIRKNHFENDSKVRLSAIKSKESELKLLESKLKEKELKLKNWEKLIDHEKEEKHGDLKILKDEIQMIDESKKVSQVEINDLRSRKRQLLKDLESGDKHLASLTNNINLENQRFSKMSKDLAVVETRLVEGKRELNDIAPTVNDHESRLKQVNQELIEKQNDMKLTEKEFHNIESAKRKLEKEVEDMLKVKADLRQEVNDSSTTLSDISNKINLGTEHLNKVSDEFLIKETKLEELRKELAKVSTHISEHENALKESKTKNKDYLNEFKKLMDDDLNTAGALNLIWKLLRDKDAKGKYQTIKEMDKVLGLNLLEKEKLTIPKEVKELAKQRLTARDNKNWQLSDELRDKINKQGFTIKDTKEGFDIKKS